MVGHSDSNDDKHNADDNGDDGGDDGSDDGMTMMTTLFKSCAVLDTYNGAIVLTRPNRQTHAERHRKDIHLSHHVHI